MQFQYIGRTSYRSAINSQRQGLILGFESEPVVTMGRRAVRDDLIQGEIFWQNMGFSLYQVDRGGQTTIHNPGQLVIFPTVDIRPWGARGFVDLLLEVTRIFLCRYGVESSCRKGEPGLFTARGKIMSVGLRVQNGVAHHGLAINVNNDLGPFAHIRVCGRAGAALDRMVDAATLPVNPLPILFLNWGQELKAQLTTPRFSPNLCEEFTAVRS